MRAPCSAGFWSCPSTLCLRRGETLLSVMPAQKPFKTNEVPRCTTHELELQEKLCCRKMYILKIIQYLCDWCVAKWYRWCPESISSPRCSASCWLGVSGNQAALAAERLNALPARTALASRRCGFLAYLCFLRVANSRPLGCLSTSGCLEFVLLS